MLRDYTLASPSLEGILSHESLSYGGLKRPALINRIFDKPSYLRAAEFRNAKNRKIIENYFHDLYEVILKRIAEFAVMPEPHPDDEVKITAMVQEFIKVKRIIIEGKRI